MKSFIVVWVTLFLASQGQSFFSTHVILTPKNIKKHKFSVSTSKKEESYTFNIKGPFKKGVWMVETKNPITELDHLNFRTKVWYNTYTHVEIIKFKKLSPGKNKSISVTLKKEELNKAYIYTDNTKPVEDGGFYYTFPLSQFVENKN